MVSERKKTMEIGVGLGYRKWPLSARKLWISGVVSERKKTMDIGVGLGTQDNPPKNMDIESGL